MCTTFETDYTNRHHCTELLRNCVKIFLPIFAYFIVGPCARELREVLGPMSIPMIGMKIPQCDESGYYLPMQCWGSTGKMT